MGKTKRVLVMVLAIALTMAFMPGIVFGASKTATKAKSIKLTNPSGTTYTMYVGTNEQFKCKLSPEKLTSKAKAVVWKSSNSTVAKVSSKGKVTPLENGKTKITVKTKVGGKSASVTVTVIDKAYAAVTSEAEIESALSNTDVKTIGLANDVTIDKSLNVPAGKKIKTSGHKLTLASGTVLTVDGTLSTARTEITGAGIVKVTDKGTFGLYKGNQIAPGAGAGLNIKGSNSYCEVSSNANSGFDYKVTGNGSICIFIIDTNDSLTLADGSVLKITDTLLNAGTFTPGKGTYEISKSAMIANLGTITDMIKGQAEIKKAESGSGISIFILIAAKYHDNGIEVGMFGDGTATLLGDINCSYLGIMKVNKGSTLNANGHTITAVNIANDGIINMDGGTANIAADGQLDNGGTLTLAGGKVKLAPDTSWLYNSGTITGMVKGNMYFYSNTDKTMGAMVEKWDGNSQTWVAGSATLLGNISTSVNGYINFADNSGKESKFNTNGFSIDESGSDPGWKISDGSEITGNW